MAGALARDVTRDQLHAARRNLELAVSRLNDAVQVMLDNDLQTIQMRAHVAMTRGVKSVCSMASEAVSRAEEASVATDLGVQTTIQRSKDRHAAYGKKKPSKKKAPPA